MGSERRFRRSAAGAAGTIAAVAADDDRVLTRQGQDRKAELLEHAERLFTERGFANTRMVDIADAAGVAKGLVYWYFESKQALLKDIVLDMRDRLRVAQAEAVREADTPLERIYRGVHASVLFVAEHWQLYGMIINIAREADGDGSDPMGETSREHAIDTVRQIEIGQRSGAIRDDEQPLALALSVQGVVNHLAVAALRQQIESVEEAAGIAARGAVRLLAASDEIAAELVARLDDR